MRSLRLRWPWAGLESLPARINQSAYRQLHAIPTNPRNSRNGLGGGTGRLFPAARRLAVPRANSFGAGHIFGGGFTQPIQILRRDVRLALLKRHCDSGFVEGVEDGEPQIRARAPAFVEVVDKRVEFEVESVCAEIKIDGRRGYRHDIRIVLRDLEKSCPDLACIAAVAQADRDHNAADIVAKRPILHLLSDETGIWNENAGSLRGLDLGRTNADFAHIALFTTDNDQVANLYGPLRQEDQARHEIVDHGLQAKTDSDGERPGQDGQIGKIEARIGKRSKRRDHDADIAHADADRLPYAARNPGRLEDSPAQPALEQPRRAIS